jgi:thiamine-phosphate pyrophosphorylase
VSDGADYIGCGPTFASKTKQFSQFPGLEFLRAASREISLPAFAIGGISETNASQVIEAGIQRVAVSAAVVEAADPAMSACRLLQMLHESDIPPSDQTGQGDAL